MDIKNLVCVGSTEYLSEANTILDLHKDIMQVEPVIDLSHDISKRRLLNYSCVGAVISHMIFIECKLDDDLRSFLKSNSIEFGDIGIYCENAELIPDWESFLKTDDNCRSYSIENQLPFDLFYES